MSAEQAGLPRGMPQLQHVRCFVAVAQEMHFSRAAAKLGLTPSPLSRNIQQLEWSLGVVLLERQQQAVQLTAAGRAFLPQALHLLEVAGALETAMRHAGARPAQRVVLAHVPGAGFALVPKLVRAAADALPQIEISLREMTNTEALAALRSHRLALAIVRAPADCRGLKTRCLVREPMVAALPEQDPRVALQQLTPQDFDGLPFVMYRPGNGGYYYEMLSSAFHHAGVTPHVVQRVKQTHTILGLVARGIGAALLPASAMASRYAGVAFRPAALPEQVISQLHLVWREHADFAATPAGRLVRFIRQR